MQKHNDYAPGEFGGSVSARSDDLLLCLEAVAAYYGRSTSAVVLTAGLPLEMGKLTPALLPKAAERIGIRALQERAKIKDLVPLDVPAILVCEGGQMLVLFGGGPEAGYAVLFPEEREARKVPAGALEALYSGICFKMKPSYEAEVAGGQVKTDTRAWFWGAISGYWRSYSLVIIAAVMINIIALAAPVFTMNVYDRVIPNKAVATLWVFVAGLLVAFGFDLALKLARSKILDRVGRKIDIELAFTLLRKTLTARLSERPETAGILANKFQEYEAVREFLSSNTVMMFVDIAFFFLFALVIYAIGGWIVVIPMAALLLVVGLGFLLQSRLTNVIRNMQSEAALRHSVVVEAVSSLETIKSIRAEGHVLRRWESYAKAAAESAEQSKYLSALGLHVTGFIQQVVLVLIVVAGCYEFAAGKMSTGAIIACVMLSNRLIAPLSQIAQMFTRARYVALALHSLDEIMNKTDELVAQSGFVNRKIAQGHLEFRKVQFRYPNSKALILDEFSLVVKRGERVGIIGRIGSGKTTIGRLLTNLYQPVSGEILIDGVDIQQYHPHEVRSAIALVGQEAELFYGTVRENIVMGDPTASDEAIVQAARRSGAERFIAADPKGFDLNVGERGSRLSGGQRQCVALARSFLTDPAVLFLDEPSSAMDQQTERQFIEQVRQALRPDQTLIVTTHRNSMLQLVDRLVVIENGRVVGDGPRDKVIEALVKQRAGGQ